MKIALWFEQCGRSASFAGCALALSLAGCASLDAGGNGSQQLPSGGAGEFGVAGASGIGALPSGQAGMPGALGAAGATGAAGTIGSGGFGAGGMPSMGGAGIGNMTGRGGAGAGGGGLGGTGAGGRGGAGGMTSGAGGAAGAGAGGMIAAMGETGVMVGMTAAHNAVRAKVQTTPALQPLTWSTTLAAYAQEWADNQAMTACGRAQHRDGLTLQQKGYGENLAQAIGVPAPNTDAQWAVDGWAGEVKCWTYGTINDPLRGGGTEKCDMTCYEQMSSDGCGHYTAIVWRNTKQVGCGFASCQTNGATAEIWICNYSPPGNVVGTAPY